MKSLRKSLNGNNKDTSSLRNQISTPLPLPPISKPPSAILPPQKVIRALASYRPQAPQELPFQKGDFFYVLKDVDNQGAWFEAHNPVSGARGLVPKTMFEEFSKTPAPIRTSQFGAKSPTTQTNFSPFRPDQNPPKSPKTQVFYAVVLHDFVAERADELDAKRGDPISVVAQSNREWFVAKPIGRLGRPGLIPVTFVEIRDPATNQAVTDVEALMDRGDLPKVEDWKRAMFSYKQNSITLGVIEDSRNLDPVPNSPYATQHPQNGRNSPSFRPQTPPSVVQQDSNPYVEPPRSLSPICLPEGILLSADVISFHFEMDEYWFRIDATFQPYAPPGQNVLPRCKQLVLFRVYNDFYDFQVALLDMFPREAGRQPPHPRMLPYMPGPAQHVDDEITASRRVELDEYVHKLCELNTAGARYILENQVVREFLSLKPGDMETHLPAKVEEIEALFGYGYVGPNGAEYGDEYGGEMRDQLGQMRVSERDEDQRSDGSDYEDEGYGASPQRKEPERHPYSAPLHQPRPSIGEPQHSSMSLRQHAHAHNHQRAGSNSSYNRVPSPGPNHSSSGYATGSSRPSSPIREYHPRSGPGRSPLESDTNRMSTHSSSASHGRWPDTNTSPPPTGRSSQAPSVSRTRSQSNGASNLNNPPISAANSQTAFVKIKIFDRVADDLIAIRVHPLVGHSELMDKVQARLGGEVAKLRFRDSLNGTFVGLEGDQDLREWMAHTDKHVLYAD